jgi:hypothetical protein
MLRDAPDGAPQHERFFNEAQAFSVRPEEARSAVSKDGFLFQRAANPDVWFFLPGYVDFEPPRSTMEQNHSGRGCTLGDVVKKFSWGTKLNQGGRNERRTSVGWYT